MDKVKVVMEVPVWCGAQMGAVAQLLCAMIERPEVKMVIVGVAASGLDDHLPSPSAAFVSATKPEVEDVEQECINAVLYGTLAGSCVSALREETKGMEPMRKAGLAQIYSKGASIAATTDPSAGCNSSDTEALADTCAQLSKPQVKPS